MQGSTRVVKNSAGKKICEVDLATQQIVISLKGHTSLLWFDHDGSFHEEHVTNVPLNVTCRKELDGRSPPTARSLLRKAVFEMDHEPRTAA
ncbi:hypothetical protein KJY77_00245 [Canibacter sp. lx-72]|uniref:hypothetical protein n=1 Tax=Canibacter zhuwentaonis TaxID=2837491 RepID=UPI001BDBC26E|nr:hypothetical protein [Canibacter zhuwentaonis]MBT1017576.1 hypothetical protein [Canibacter zhuwentaonis]